MTYAEKLKDPRWQTRRDEILALDKYKCRRCGTKLEILNVHHLCYIPGREPWDYQDSQLITLCEICHRHTHEEMKLKEETKGESNRARDIYKAGDLLLILVNFYKKKFKNG